MSELMDDARAKAVLSDLICASTSAAHAGALCHALQALDDRVALVADAKAELDDYHPLFSQQLRARIAIVERHMRGEAEEEHKPQ